MKINVFFVNVQKLAEHHVTAEGNELNRFRPSLAADYYNMVLRILITCPISSSSATSFANMLRIHFREHSL
jgi:hypothetical protein